MEAIFDYLPAKGGSRFILFLVTVGVLAVAYSLLTKSPRLPDAPILRISSKPGKRGEAEDAAASVLHFDEIAKEGWKRYSKHGINYLMSTPPRKLYIMAPKYLDEVRSAPENKVSNLAANNELMQLWYTLDPKLTVAQYHFELPIRKSLTQSLGPKLPDIVDEAKLAMQEFIGDVSSWKEFGSEDLCFNLVTRTANRLLFGPDLARNEEFQTLSILYTGVMFGGANMIRNYPNILKPLVMWWKTSIYKSQADACRLLLPIIKQRMAESDRAVAEGRQAEWHKSKPEDAIQWVLDETPPEERVPRRLVMRMLHINIAAVHTSSSTMLEILHCLSCMPEVQEELRREIEAIFRQEGGWSKQTLTYLVKLDSFLVETSRVCALSTFKMGRVTIADWVLKDGTLVPKGTYIFMNHRPLVQDHDEIENADKFDPWRMYRQRQQPGNANMHQMVMTSPLNLTFGHGKHACPGRFFAANELKTLLVLMLMKYEFHHTNLPGGLEDVIKGQWYNMERRATPNVKIAFKDRSKLVPEDLQKYFTDY